MPKLTLIYLYRLIYLLKNFDNARVKDVIETIKKSA